jgi:UDP-N-acetylglucosamine 2-epimerase (non-hydrolysing)
MKVAPVHRAFEPYGNRISHALVHTGQHYSPAMFDDFFSDLQMPAPVEFLDASSGTHAEQTARVMVRFEKVCTERKPDLVLVAGDVNSTIACALTAAKCGIPVGHIEAGLRSFDRRMPEEVNRVATDSISSYAFVTEQSGLQNLRREGFARDHIFFVGNTMIDSLHFALPAARKARVCASLGLAPRSYVLVTLHRPSNVDDPGQLQRLLKMLSDLSRRRTVVMPLHPRTRKNIEAFELDSLIDDSLDFRRMEPLGYIRFLSLLVDADFVLTDSGGIQEETTALDIPCLTLRTTTERPITCELGSNQLVPPESQDLHEAFTNLLDKPRKKGTLPPFWDGRAAERIVQTLLGLL